MGGLYFTFYDPCAKLYSNMCKIATEVGRCFPLLIVPENCVRWRCFKFVNLLHKMSFNWIRQSSDLQDHSSYNFPPTAAAAAILPNSKHKQS